MSLVKKFTAILKLNVKLQLHRDEHFVLQFLEERKAIQRDDCIYVLCPASAVVISHLRLKSTSIKAGVRVSCCTISIQIPEGALRN